MGIFDGRVGDGNEALEADCITTSVILGFCKSECERGRYIWIGYGEPGDQQNHDEAKAKLVRALTPLNAEKWIRMVQTPDWRDYRSGGSSRTRAITGAGGGYGQIDIEMSSKAMELALDLQANTQGGIGYLGDVQVTERGAYYGIIDHPTETRLISTTRRHITTGGMVGTEGPRWDSGWQAHGVIAGQLEASRTPGKSPWEFGSMAALDTPFERECNAGRWPSTGCVGYCHGMNWAIMHCKLLDSGTPYEVAVGGRNEEGEASTTKLASCFGCTTFMYANDYPPSYIHLGRAESWVPLPNNNIDNPEYTGTQTAVIDACNNRWAATVAGFLTEGATILATKASTTHRQAAQHLVQAITRRRTPLEKANMFLDALTVHDSEHKRVRRAIA